MHQESSHDTSDRRCGPLGESSAQDVPPPVDIARLVDRCLGNADFAERVLHRFAAMVGEQLDQLETSQRMGDAEAFTRVAHQMKGAAASVSAGDLARLMSELEALGRKQRLPAARTLLGAARQQATRLRTFLSELPELLGHEMEPAGSGTAGWGNYRYGH